VLLVYSSHVPVRLVEHPVAQHALLHLRSTDAYPSRFRRLAARLSALIVLEATRDLPTVAHSVTTPLEPTTGQKLVGDIVVVPVLRAGLVMAEAALELIPDARVGHIGLERDEKTANASRYYAKLPRITDRTIVLVVDPMLATGGSANAAIDLVKARGAKTIKLLSVVAAPEGVAAIERSHPEVEIVTAAVDRELNDKKYILPGLGDFGDRLYGT
jgi:uracil phosphoribosyltransferase